MSGAGKVALVTGGAKRIGAAIARGLAEAGFSVAIHCRNSKGEADELAAEIMRAGGNAQVFVADLGTPEACNALIDAVADALGPVRLLVNSASVFEPDEATDLDWERWGRHFAIHLKAPVALTSRFAAALPAELDGLVVNVIDQRVWRLNPRFFSYTLSKSALWTATQTMAQALAPRIRVNALGPGPTVKNDRQSDADFRRQTESVILGHGPTLEEFTRSILYLWEAKSVTGQLLAIDGGQHLAWETRDVTGIE
ncbi:MAG: SDR family oxidoreductase [Rhizobiaceae bacterium]|nr:SDR family oxidoreductase [Rhizobiaceae bacterium]